MRKNLLKVIGVAAILMAVALNVRHADNDYGLQNNSLWSVVGAQTTSTGTGGGSTGGGNGIHCVGVDCIGKKNCRWVHDYFWFNNVKIPTSVEVCDYYNGSRYNTCELYWPSHNNWVWGIGSCESCYQNTDCIEPFSSN